MESPLLPDTAVDVVFYAILADRTLGSEVARALGLPAAGRPPSVPNGADGAEPNPRKHMVRMVQNQPLEEHNAV